MCKKAGCETLGMCQLQHSSVVPTALPACRFLPQFPDLTSLSDEIDLQSEANPLLPEWLLVMVLITATGTLTKALVPSCFS